MATTRTIQQAFSLAQAGRVRANSIVFLGLLIGLFACGQASLPGGGPQKKLRVSVGEIKEIALSDRGDSGSELIGTSDNQEVVEVSRQQLAPAVDTLSRNKKASTVFQIKGITAGTANVIFSTKPVNQAGNGTTIRTYVVQVTAK